MAHAKRLSKEAQAPLEVQIAVTVNGESRVFREAVPNGFPTELISHLEDFWRRGFAAHDEQRKPHTTEATETVEGVDLTEYAAPLSGRPIDPAVQARGRKAAELLAKDPALTFGQIALKLCPQRANRHHRCGKKCADRIRQEVRQYDYQHYLESLQKSD